MGEGVTLGLLQVARPRPSTSEVRRRQLATLVAWSFEDSDGAYGYRRIHAHLARLGHPAHPETIRPETTGLLTE